MLHACIHSMEISLSLVGFMCRFTDRFNAISTWTSHSILQHPSPNGRANMFEQLVELCVCLESLGNYSTLMAIIAGLQQGCISRLAYTKKLIKKPILEKLAKLQVYIALIVFLRYGETASHMFFW
jgi:hypothetical protein